MSRLKLLPAILLAACSLAAQAAVDLNSLAAAAARYATRGVQGSRLPMSLDLRLMRGESGTDPNVLMNTAQDVQHWTLFYDASYPDPGPLPKSPRSASVKCTKGVFHDFLTAQEPIPECKSLDATWIPLSLDAAVAQLNAYGYVRGFTRVETRRPERPGVPPDLVYVFTCPLERTLVAISATTGALSWYQMF